MGYESQLQFIDVELRGVAIAAFVRAADDIIVEDAAEYARMLHCIKIDTGDGYLDWHWDERQRRKLRRSGEDLLKPTLKNLAALKQVFLECWIEDENNPVGKWYEAESFANWLVNYCRSGKILEISQEGDGAVRGWQFGRRGMRELGIVPVSQWWAPARQSVRSKRAATE